MHDPTPIANPPVPSSENLERTIEITRSLRKVADELLEYAQKEHAAGNLSLEDFFKFTDGYQMIINQANVACYEAASHLPPLDEHLKPIETATQTLAESATKLAKAADVLSVSAGLLQGLAALVAAIMNPGPAAFASVAVALAAAAQGISDTV